MNEHQSTILEPNSWLFRLVTTRLVSYSYKGPASYWSIPMHPSRTWSKISHVKRPCRWSITRSTHKAAISKRHREPCSLTWPKNCFISVGGRKETWVSCSTVHHQTSSGKTDPRWDPCAQKEDLERKWEDPRSSHNRSYSTGFDNNPATNMWTEQQPFVPVRMWRGFPNVLFEALPAKKIHHFHRLHIRAPSELPCTGDGPVHSAITSYEVAEYASWPPWIDVANLAASMKKCMKTKAYGNVMKKGYVARGTIRCQ